MDEDRVSTIQIHHLQTGATLAERVAESLRSMILEGALKPGAQLPTEPDLSKALNVSRSTLRSALERLEREGFVLRRRGVGTFVAEEPLTVNNLNLNWGVTQVIRSTGATPGIAELRVTLEFASLREAKRLELSPASRVVLVERVRTADGRRVVFARDVVPLNLMVSGGQDVPISELEAFLVEHQSMYSFFRERLAFEPHHAVAWLRPMIADHTVAEKLTIPLGEGILYLEQVDYDPNGRPLVLADEYHVAGAFTFAVYRTHSVAP
jgi:GntR family transcriptional regulator